MCTFILHPHPVVFYCNRSCHISISRAPILFLFHWYLKHHIQGVSCSDFEGRWEAIDGDDYSNLLISIVCDGDTATIRYVDDKWAAMTCGEFGGPGGFEADYTLNTDNSSIDGNEVLTVSCQDGTEETKDFGLNPLNKFVLQDNGSLQWFEFYNFWPTSTN